MICDIIGGTSHPYSSVFAILLTVYWTTTIVLYLTISLRGTICCIKLLDIALDIWQYKQQHIKCIAAAIASFTPLKSAIFFVFYLSSDRSYNIHCKKTMALRKPWLTSKSNFNALLQYASGTPPPHIVRSKSLDTSLVDMAYNTASIVLGLLICMRIKYRIAHYETLYTLRVSFELA